MSDHNSCRDRQRTKCDHCGLFPVWMTVTNGHPVDVSMGERYETLIDACIAPIIKALNNAGVPTSSHCCRHGKGKGVIFLHDGRVIEITNPKEE